MATKEVGSYPTGTLRGGQSPRYKNKNINLFLTKCICLGITSEIKKKNNIEMREKIESLKGGQV